MSPKLSDFERELHAPEQPRARTPTAKNGASSRAPSSNGEHQEPPDPLEQEVIGRLFLGAKFTDIAHLVRVEDYQPSHRLILSAIATLAREGQPYNLPIVQGQLERMGHLAAAGGISYLLAVQRNTLGPENVEVYARKVRERALMGRIGARNEVELQQRRQELRQQSQMFEELHALEDSPTRAIVLRHVADIVEEHREVEWLGGLYEILERRVLAVLAGPRNTMKSFIALHWIMLAALKGEPAVMLSAEGGGLGRRIEAWLSHYAPKVNVRELPLLVLERAVNLNALAVLEDLRTAITVAKITPTIIVVDTLSKYSPGLKENATEEMTAFLSALGAGLRDHYGATVLLVTHSGHADPRRPRGSSTLMANPDAEYIVERPNPSAMTVTVTRERFKDSPTMAALGYAAEVVDLRRLDRYQKPVTALVLKDTEAAAVSGADQPEVRGKNQRQLLKALRAQAADSAGIWTLAELREVGRSIGLTKGRAREVAEWLATSPFMVKTVGGLKLADG